MQVLVAAAGLAYGFSLIVAIGPQNTFVLRQGVRREHVVPVVLVCIAADLVLIAIGVSGIGAALEQSDVFGIVLGIAGAAFLLGYAALAARRALRPTPPEQVRSGPAVISTTTAISTALAFTLLNPSVYIDTVILLGSVAHTYAGQMWWFAIGAMLASVIWFAALGYGARLLAPVLTRPSAERVLEALVAVIMVLAAVRLLVVTV